MSSMDGRLPPVTCSIACPSTDPPACSMSSITILAATPASVCQRRWRPRSPRLLRIRRPGVRRRPRAADLRLSPAPRTITPGSLAHHPARHRRGRGLPLATPLNRSHHAEVSLRRAREDPKNQAAPVARGAQRQKRNTGLRGGHPKNREPAGPVSWVPGARTRQRDGTGGRISGRGLRRGGGGARGR